MANELYKKILKNKDLSNIVLKEDEKIEFISTGVMTLNLLFSGKIDRGIPISKVSTLSSESSLGKSFVGLSTLKNAQKKGLYTIVLDTEFSFDFDFAKQIGIKTDEKNFLVIQNNSIEQVQQKILEILEPLDKEERKKIFFLLDSLGGLVTSKTIGDAVAGKDVKDMTITQKKNNFSKILMGTGATFFVVNHVYSNVGGFGSLLSISGGGGIKYASHCIVMGQSKAKDKDSQQEIKGSIVSCITYKSRFGKENSKLKFRIKHEGGLDIFYGLLPDALEHGSVYKPTNGTYSRKHIKDDKKFREKDIYNSNFWVPIFKETDFKEYLEDKYTFKNKDLDIANINEEEILG